MKVVIPGGSGHIGMLLGSALHADGHEVVVLSRRPRRQPWRVVLWDGASVGAWCEEIEGSDVVINLAGRSVNCRYTPATRREILQSRVTSTAVVGAAIGGAARPPRVWLQASTATIYSHRYDGANDERCGVLGGDESNAPSAWRFSIEVATAWEHALDQAVSPNTRKVALRSAMTMSPDRGSVFDILLGLVRHGLGGAAGDGTQFMSWIHDADFIAAVRWLIDRDDCAGAVNVASPNPLTNREFMRVLRNAAGVSFGLTAHRWMLEAAAVFLKTEPELVLKSRRVVPTRLLESGFVFRFPTWPQAAADLYRRWKVQADAPPSMTSHITSAA